MPEDSQREPFIASQRFLLLETNEHPKQFLNPGDFREARMRAFAKETNEDGILQRVPTSTMDGESWLDAWKPKTRDELLGDSSIQRLCLTIDGGVGKTTTLRWYAAYHARLDPDRADNYLAILIDLKRCSGDLKTAFEQRADQQRSNETLLSILRQNLLHISDNPKRPIRDLLAISNAGMLAAYLRRKFASGRMTLLIDGLDLVPAPRISLDMQASLGAGETINPVIGGLNLLIHGIAKTCRIILTGRPHAVTRYWSELFEEDHSWQFAQIDSFRDESERKQFLGDRYSLIEQLDAESLENPRLLSAIRKLPKGKLQSIRTTSELYSELMNHLWRSDAGTNPEIARRESESMQLLAALAFELFRNQNWGGIDSGQFPSFKEELILHAGKQLGVQTVSQLDDRLVKLGETNAELKFSLLDTDLQLSDLYFRDTTIQEFFTGLWLASYASPEDIDWIGQYLYLKPHEQLDNENLYRVWRFAVEMPCERSSNAKWLGIASKLFEPNPKIGRRSNEMMYRAWDRLNAIAEQPDKGFMGPSPETKRAREILDRFQSEFHLELLLGKHGAKSKGIAEELVSSFVPIPPVYRGPEDLRFTCGLSDEQQKHPVVTIWGKETQQQIQLWRRFELATTPVTCEQYGLYEPMHASYFSNELGREQTSRHPVESVHWYGAKMFSRWVTQPRLDWRAGVKRPMYDLPHELEWEFAARAGTTTIWHFCDDNISEKQIEALLRKHAVLRAKSTQPVGQRHANPWGLHDMLGNVWEWCDSPYDGIASAKDFSKTTSHTSRVCRGGGWLSFPSYVRASVRNYYHPAYLLNDIGFRLARA